jgi:hypothetical protein
MLDRPALKPVMLMPLLGSPPKGKTPAQPGALEFSRNILPLAQ